MPEPQDNFLLTRFMLRKLLDDLYLGLKPSLCDGAGEYKFKVNVTAASGDVRVFTISFSENGDLQSVTIEFAHPQLEPITVSSYVSIEDLNITVMKNLATFINITCLIAPACFLPITFDKSNRLDMRAADSTYGHLFKTALKSGVNIDSSVYQFFNTIRLDVRVKGEYNVIPY